MADQWYDMDSKDAAERARSVCNKLWDQSSNSRQRARRQIERYHGASLDPSLWRQRYQIQEDLPLVWNLSRALCGTVESRIGAVGNPKLQFVTSDANWSVRRRGQKLDQFIDAISQQSCEPYANVHELRSALLRDACIFHRGVCQVEADVDMGRVLTERCFPWEVMVDVRDARYGAPTEYIRTCTISRSALHAWYDDISEAGGYIDSAREATDADLEIELGLQPRASSIVTEIVRGYHIWRVAFGPNNKGRHLFFLESGGPALIDEDWELEFPPLPTMWWDKPVLGIWAQSLLDEVSSVEDDINRLIQRIDNSIRRTGMGTILCPTDSVDPAQFEDTQDAQVIPYVGTQAPTFVAPQPYGQQHLEWVNANYEKAFELTGISQMASTAQKEPGLTAAAAINAVSSLQSQRFAVLSRAQGQFMIRWAQCAIHAIRKIADKDKDFAAKWPGAGFLKSIRWRDVDLENDSYQLQIKEVGELKNEPADRLQRAEQLLGSGLISQQAYMAIYMSTQDIQAEAGALNVQEDLISSYIDHWLDSTDEQRESGMWDTEKEIPLVPPPIRFLPSMPSAILQVGIAYMKAELDGAPDAVRQLFLDWLEMAETELESQEARKQAAATALQSATQMAATSPGVAQAVMQGNSAASEIQGVAPNSGGMAA